MNLFPKPQVCESTFSPLEHYESFPSLRLGTSMCSFEGLPINVPLDFWITLKLKRVLMTVYYDRIISPDERSSLNHSFYLSYTFRGTCFTCSATRLLIPSNTSEIHPVRSL